MQVRYHQTKPVIKIFKGEYTYYRFASRETPVDAKKFVDWSFTALDLDGVLLGWEQDSIIRADVFRIENMVPMKEKKQCRIHCQN